MTFEQIKANYNNHLWNDVMVATAVKKGVITKAQYKEITGKDYK